VLDAALFPVFSTLGEAALKPFAPLRRHKRIYWGVYVCALLQKLRLGEFLEAYDERTLLLDQVLWDEAKRRGIIMKEFRFLGSPTASFVATYPAGKKIYFNSFPVPPGSSEGVWWIDNKEVLKKKLHKAGIPVAKGGGSMTKRRAVKIFDSLTSPVIVKPYQGSGSRHTTTHIQTREALERAFLVSQEISPVSIIEEELVGAVYRPTLVGGKLIATIRRDVPQVVGDGTHTLQELVEKENEHPKRAGPYFSPIKFEDANLIELARQDMTQESVPKKDQVVFLHQKINWSVGGTTTDVTDEVHPDNKVLFEKIAKLLDAPLIGIDFIIGDISKSWKEQERCGVIECNSRPFFDNHHLPFKGHPRDVAGVIWDYFETGKA
jgi:D-alanine-D-alanine ligase-like ATP-grasp enzyme